PITITIPSDCSSNVPRWVGEPRHRSLTRCTPPLPSTWRSNAFRGGSPWPSPSPPSVCNALDSLMPTPSGRPTRHLSCNRSAATRGDCYVTGSDRSSCSILPRAARGGGGGERWGWGGGGGGRGGGGGGGAPPPPQAARFPQPRQPV